MNARALIPALGITCLLLLSGSAVVAESASGWNPTAADEPDSDGAHRPGAATGSTDQQTGRELDFFVGDWDVRIVDRNETTIARAKTSARFTMDGTAIQDDWMSLDPAGNVIFRGTSIRTFVPETKRWVVHWVMANTPGYTYIDAVWTGEELHGTGTGFDGRGEFQERFRYFDITSESYSFSLERSYDGAATWEHQPELRAVKIKGT